MHNIPGLSVYISSFALQRAMLDRRRGTGSIVFLSLHMGEEFSHDYCAKTTEVCEWLSAAGYRIIADVSPKTMAQFGEADLASLARRLGLWALRVDYGLDVSEIISLARRVPVVLNASTVASEIVKHIARADGQVLAMFNFYPRPETGLDEDFLLNKTRELKDAGAKVYAFIPGDTLLRGPLHSGLPTLERHRTFPPSVAFAEMILRFGMDGVCIGDPGVSDAELDRMERLCRESVIELPAVLDQGHGDLYGRIFTVRLDSPSGLIRFAESREYSCAGKIIEPSVCGERPRGSITMDNSRYGRYSGELQILRRSYPADARVNVIGAVSDSYMPAADVLSGGMRFTLVPE